VRLDVFFTPGELAGAELPERAVVIDVLRATSTVVEALANGARAVFPVDTADDAVRIAQNLGRDSVLLCGERKALPIEGFDLGNSPREFTAEQVSDKALVMTTTNGTRAFLAVADRRSASSAEGGAIMVASFLNLSAVVRRIVEKDGSVAVVCAGREGRFGLDDAACAGAVIRGVEASGTVPELNDAGRAARSLAENADVDAILRASAAGRHLAEVELGEDVAFCARVDRTDAVPVLRERKITVE
jgi:2-phosphosulfolactate phosphatase